MPRQHSGPRSGASAPSARHSKVFIAAVLLGTILALGLVFSITAAGVFRELNPQLTLRLQPWDSRAKASAALALASGDRSAVWRSVALARSAIAGDPFVNDAYIALASVKLRAGASLAALEPLVSYSEDLSRRHLPTELWLIERDVEKGDLEGTLRHYDIAMRTEPSSRETLFPVLSQAAADPVVARGLHALLLRAPDWQDDFIEYYVPRAENARELAFLATPGLDSETALGRSHTVAVINRLVELGAPQLAWSLYRRLPKRASADRKLIRDGSFEVEAGYPPFDWMYSNDFTLAPERQPRPDGKPGNALFFPPAPNADGEFARQLLSLPEGRYSLALDVSGIVGPAQLRPRVLVRCAGKDGAQISGSELPAVGGAAQRLNIGFSVPPNCANQWISFYILGGWRPAEGQEAWVSNVTVGRV